MSSIFQKIPFNYNYQVSIYNAADYNITPNTATGIVTNQVLSSVFIPGRSFIREGQEIFYRAAGRTSGTGSKSLRLRLNTLSLIAVTAITPNNNTSWLFEAVLTLRTSTVLYKSCKFFYNMGETAGSATPSILGTSGTLGTAFDITTADLTFDLEVDIAVAAETIREDNAAIAIL